MTITYPMKFTLLTCLATEIAFATSLFAWPPVQKSGIQELARARRRAAWHQATEARIAKDPTLKAIAAKYPLVVLHSRGSGGSYGESAYSFIYETSDESKHFNDVHVLFANGPEKGLFDINMLTNQQNLVADLGLVDFTIDPDPKQVSIDGDGQSTWLPDRCKAVVGHVYLERVRDTNGNRFYVLFKVVALDEDGRFMAFLWRRLPGGKVVRVERS